MLPTVPATTRHKLNCELAYERLGCCYETVAGV